MNSFVEITNEFAQSGTVTLKPTDGAASSAICGAARRLGSTSRKSHSGQRAHPQNSTATSGAPERQPFMESSTHASLFRIYI